MNTRISDYTEFFSTTACDLQTNAIRRLMPLMSRPGMISLAGGAPSPETFPSEELAEIAARVIRQQPAAVLQYGPTRGRAGLIAQVCEYLESRGIAEVDPSRMVITTGSQQGLDLAARVIMNPGDVALVELPGYVGGTIALHNSGARMVGVRLDQDGMVIDDLRHKIEHELRKGSRVKCIYTTPNFQNPSGVTMAGSRREKLVEIALEYNLLIIEDDPYYELYFDSNPARPESLSGLAPASVIQLGSFSKVLSPGLRMAWLNAPQPIAQKIEFLKEGTDLSSSLLDQAIVQAALESGLVSKRLPAIRTFYAVRCEAMIQALRRFAPPDCTWTEPKGGFFVFLTLPEMLDAGDLLALAIERGAAFVPGQSFFVDGSGANTARLAFSKESPDALEKGIQIVCEALNHQKAGCETGKLGSAKSAVE